MDTLTKLKMNNCKTTQVPNYYHTVELMLVAPSDRMPPSFRIHLHENRQKKAPYRLSDNDFVRLFPHFQVGAIYVREHADRGPFFVSTIYENSTTSKELPTIIRRPKRLPLSVNIADFRVLVITPEVEDPIWWFMDGVPMDCESPAECEEDVAIVMQGYLDAVVDEIGQFLEKEGAIPVAL